MNGNGRKVLVLDPRDAYRPMLEQLNRKRRLKVEWANEASGAMKKLASNHYDCVIVDADAPGARRHGFLAALRSCAPAVKILVLAARRIEELPLELDDGIIYCFVRKPTY